jgi:hypothetical protein
MRSALPTPGATAFAWVVYNPPGTATVQTLIKTKLGASNKPCVNGDTQLVLPPGQESVGFGDGSPIFAAYTKQLITAFVVTYPPLSGARSPVSGGLILPMSGGLVGCVRFAGLTNSIGKRATQDSARKTLVDVAIDPLHPLDPKRNYQLFTGENFILSQDGNTYSISRA